MRAPGLGFALARVLLGLHLAVSFGALAPHAAELFGPASIFGARAATPFPNLFAVVHSAGQAQVILVVLTAASLALAAGLARRPLALVLWYGWACLTHWISFVWIPSDGFVGWLLLACALVPAGEPLSRGARADWRLPGTLVAGAWAILGLGYFASGLDKLGSDPWRTGTALALVLDSPIARAGGVAEALRGLPSGWLRAVSHATLGLELASPLLFAVPRLRTATWLAWVALHATVAATLAISSVSFAMLSFHLFVLDPRWLGRRSPPLRS